MTDLEEEVRRPSRLSSAGFSKTLHADRALVIAPADDVVVFPGICEGV